jgi:hypothetical protein
MAFFTTDKELFRLQRVELRLIVCSPSSSASKVHQAHPPFVSTSLLSSNAEPVSVNYNAATTANAPPSNGAIKPAVWTGATPFFEVLVADAPEAGSWSVAVSFTVVVALRAP